ncbi:hypothetical protein Rhow_002327 [Rhodococcus wratislaviensis]|uniref:Uncharacterized protein n=1 Tax=Rhodococcus wratislaviensis TaxID=44752 RepID=A0A402C5D4_RHOWR|nr:hypothetical protein Rhow_002327 [Rhodococcus wratislaviensis]
MIIATGIAVTGHREILGPMVGRRRVDAVLDDVPAARFGPAAPYPSSDKAAELRRPGSS